MSRVDDPQLDLTPEVIHSEPEQQALIDALPVEVDRDPMAVAPPFEAPATPQLSDFVLSMPVPQMVEALNQYDDRRAAFRTWLLGKFEQGVHYGFPPGCEAKLDEQGNIKQWKKGRNGSQGQWVVIGRDQWRAAPTLYQAGAELLCDLFFLRPVFHADESMWRMLGEPAGVICIRCDLHARGGEKVGEGRGAFKVGDRAMYDNSAIKMSEKRALVDGVKRTFLLSDLFTQDRDDHDAKANPRPEQDENAEGAPTRDERSEHGKFVARWKAVGRWFATRNGGKTEGYADWVASVAGVERETLTNRANWTVDLLEKCEISITETLEAEAEAKS